MMRAQGFLHCGPPEVLQEFRIPKPIPGPLDVLVRVEVAGLNPVDTKLRSGAGTSGSAPSTVVADAPTILGFDAVGTIEAVGSDVTRFAVGERIWYAGVTGRQGSYAQWQCVDHRLAALCPRQLSSAECAVIPLATLTAWECLFEQMGAGDAHGKICLITGGAGGVGSLAIQIATRVLGLQVVATATRPESREWCMRMGARWVIPHAQNWEEEYATLGIAAPDLILHTADPSALNGLLRLVAPFGKVCTIVGGAALANIDVSPLMAKRGSLSFEMMFARARFGVEPEKQGQILSTVTRLFEGDVLETTLSQVLAWEDVALGHQMLESRRTIGKLALEIPAP